MLTTALADCFLECHTLTDSGSHTGTHPLLRLALMYSALLVRGSVPHCAKSLTPPCLVPQAEGLVILFLLAPSVSLSGLLFTRINGCVLCMKDKYVSFRIIHSIFCSFSWIVSLLDLLIQKPVIFLVFLYINDKYLLLYYCLLSLLPFYH